MKNQSTNLICKSCKNGFLSSKEGDGIAIMSCNTCGQKHAWSYSAEPLIETPAPDWEEAARRAQELHAKWVEQEAPGEATNT
jgi:hypothetical protein